MKVLKIILLILAVLIGGFLIWMATIDPNYDVSREVEINASPEKVWASVDDLTEWQYWSPWGLRDTTMTTTYGEIFSGEGGSYSWSGDPEITGKGSMTISKSIDYEYQEVDLNFTEPMEVSSVGYFKLEATENGTRVIWGNKGSMPFLFRFMTAGMDEMMGADFVEGLDNLKNHVESKKDESPAGVLSAVEVVDFPARTYHYTLMENVPFDNIGEAMGQGFGMLMQNLGPAASTMEGMPFAIYTMWDEENMRCTFKNCVIISGDAEANDVMMIGEYTGGQAIQATWTGPYEGTGAAHMAIEEYSIANNLVIEEAWELYENDPSTVAPEEILTRVVYPIVSE